MSNLKLARFDLDATPPTGHPLCGGWIQPVVGVDDPLRFRGVVVLGADQPIVLATLDWTGVLNDSHRLWIEALADAAGTSPERVALHCVHQHNAPFIDRTANALLRAEGVTTSIQDDAFIDSLVARSSAAVRDSLRSARDCTHIAAGVAKVEQVACNRRVIGANGKIRFTRTSATKDPVARAEPEGTIDPFLRSISLFDGDQPLARLSFYATHPMSYYGDGRASSDFVGLARLRRDYEEPGTLHLYFTGGAGNITAGKYNDGSKVNRAILADRIHRAMVAADRDGSTRAALIDRARWTVNSEHPFPVREDLTEDYLLSVIRDPKSSTADRHRSAMALTWAKRDAKRFPVRLGALSINGVSTLHLPAETFIEYQIHAREVDPARFVAVAAYGDGGPWYIPLRRSYAEGGYEPSVSFVSPATEKQYKEVITRTLIDSVL